jgi:WD40 repeat protein
MAPIIDIKINPVTAQIISLSHDKTIKVWDLRHQQCLQTISDTPVQRPENLFSCIFFNKEQGGRLIAASSTLNVFNIQEKVSVQAEVKSHDFPIRNLLLNPAFGQVVSGCNGGVVNIWDIVSGAKTFRFSEVHGKVEITAMTFDDSGRRLITGGRGGMH